MADAHDFSNPVMAAAIVKADGTRVPLWVNPDPQQALGLPGILTITDMTVEIGLGFVPKISATMNIPFDDLITLLDATAAGQGIAWLEDHIEVQFGYVGSSGATVLSPPYSGFLDKPEVSIGTESSITLTGIGTAAWSATRQGRGRAFSNMTRFDIIEALAQGSSPSNPRKISVSDTLISTPFGDETLPKDVVSHQALRVDKVTVAGGYTSDWHMILRMAKEAHCWVLYSTSPAGDKISLLPFSGIYGSTPKHRFQMFSNIGTFGPTNGLYPILSFNSPTTGVYYASETRGRFLKAIASGSGEALAEFYGDDDTKGAKPANRSGGGGGQPNASPQTPEPDEATGDGMANASADQPTDQTVARLRSEVTRSLTKGMGVRVEIETLGVPDLLPGAMIEVVGMSKLFSYNYCVHEITHSLGTGGYTSSIVAYSNSGAVQREVQRVAGLLVNEPAPVEEDQGNTAQGGAG